MHVHSWHIYIRVILRLAVSQYVRADECTDMYCVPTCARLTSVPVCALMHYSPGVFTSVGYGVHVNVQDRTAERSSVWPLEPSCLSSNPRSSTKWLRDLSWINYLLNHFMPQFPCLKKRG